LRACRYLAEELLDLWKRHTQTLPPVSGVEPAFGDGRRCCYAEASTHQQKVLAKHGVNLKDLFVKVSKFYNINEAAAASAQQLLIPHSCCTVLSG
jgi:hypothetical protein